MTPLDEADREAGGATLRLRVPPDARYGKYVRERLLSFGSSFEIGESDLCEFVTAIGEALANSIEHAQTADSIEVSAWLLDGDKLIATIVDTGVGFADPPSQNPALPPNYSERGRGMPIMKQCTDLFTVRSSPGEGTSVILGRYLRSKRPTEAPVPAG